MSSSISALIADDGTDDDDDAVAAARRPGVLDIRRGENEAPAPVDGADGAASPFIAICGSSPTVVVVVTVPMASLTSLPT